MWAIVDLTAEQTHPLRRTVLRDGTASDDVVFDGDGDADTFHLGAEVGGGIGAVSTWVRRRYPDLPAQPAHQLRGMATEVALRGSGVSSTLLSAGLERCRDAGSDVVWARARVTALSFYLRHGFETRGVQYVDLTTGLPHHDIVLSLTD